MALTKREVRKQALALRDALPAEKRNLYSEKITACLTASGCYQEAQALLIYVSFRSEVDTTALIREAFAHRKAVYVPRVSGREMDFFRIYDFSELSAGYRGILEPSAENTLIYQTDSAEKTLLCLPGAAFDRARHRIGYGGGFYDRYLSGWEEAKKEGYVTAALAYECQVMEEIPWEPWDIQPQFIVTERGIF